MINSAESDEALERKRIECIESIMRECGIREFTDTSPSPQRI